MLLWFGIGFVVLAYLVALVVVHRPQIQTVTASGAAPLSVKETNIAETVQSSDALSVVSSWDENIQKWTTAEDGVQDAELKIHQGQLEDAEKKLRAALQLNPSSVNAQLALARVCARLNKHDEVLNLLNSVLAADPDRATAKLLLAQTLTALGQFAPALSVAKWIIRGDPYSMEAHQLAATALLNLKQPSDAIDHLRKIINVDRENITAYNLLADAYTQMGLNGKVIETLDQVRQIDPNNSVSYYNLAICYARQNMVTQAVETLTRATSAFGPSFVHTWTEAQDFDGLRDSEAFKKLQEQLEQPVVTGATTTSTATP